MLKVMCSYLKGNLSNPFKQRVTHIRIYFEGIILMMMFLEESQYLEESVKILW